MDINPLDKLVACRECDLLIERINLAGTQQAHCPRCNSLLYQGKQDHLNKTLVISGSGLLMVLPAYFMPMMNVAVLGKSNAVSVFESIPPMMNTSFWIAGVGLILFAMVFPILILSISFFISLHLKLNRCPVYLCEFQKLFQRLIHWSMSEVYFLGVLVALIKLLDDFTVIIGPGLYCFVLMMFCSLLVTTTVSRQYFWETLYHAKSF